VIGGGRGGGGARGGRFGARDFRDQAKLANNVVDAPPANSNPNAAANRSGGGGGGGGGNPNASKKAQAPAADNSSWMMAPNMMNRGGNYAAGNDAW